MASKWDIRKPKRPPVVKEVVDLPSRVVPPLLARDLEVLDLVLSMPPSTRSSTLVYELKARYRKISERMQEKFSSQIVK